MRTNNVRRVVEAIVAIAMTSLVSAVFLNIGAISVASTAAASVAV